MSFSELSMQVHSNSRPVKRASYFQLMAVCKSLSPVFVRVLFTPVETRGDTRPTSSFQLFELESSAREHLSD